MVQQLWLRCEKKEFERRSALTPTTAKKLLDAGFEITVERDEQRIFDDSEFEAYVLHLSYARTRSRRSYSPAWAVNWSQIVHHGPGAPTDVPIINLVELPNSDDPLPHTHIQFAHCYKKTGRVGVAPRPIPYRG